MQRQPGELGERISNVQSRVNKIEELIGEEAARPHISRFREMLRLNEGSSQDERTKQSNYQRILDWFNGHIEKLKKEETVRGLEEQLGEEVGDLFSSKMND